MSIQVRRRREAASFLANFTGAQGELIVDTTNNRVQVHDGATPGGWPAAKLAEALTNAAKQSMRMPNRIASTAVPPTRMRTVSDMTLIKFPRRPRLGGGKPPRAPSGARFCKRPERSSISRRDRGLLGGLQGRLRRWEWIIAVSTARGR